MPSNPSPFVFVIDTEEYAGNFERELCAYITGITGECGVGDEYTEMFDEEVKDSKIFEDVVEQVPDDHGCHRPCSIWETPGWFNNGLGGHYKDVPESIANALAEYKKEGIRYKIENKKGAQSRLDDLKSGKEKETKDNTIKIWEKEVANYDKEIKKYEKETKIQKYPAYLSVAIFFNKKPTKDQIALMKERAEIFSQMKREWGTKFKITGYRLVKQNLKTQPESI